MWQIHIFSMSNNNNKIFHYHVNGFSFEENLQKGDCSRDYTQTKMTLKDEIHTFNLNVKIESQSAIMSHYEIFFIEVD